MPLPLSIVMYIERAFNVIHSELDEYTPFTNLVIPQRFQRILYVYTKEKGTW
jgi:hypothetical protein